MNKLKQNLYEFRLLLKSAPSIITTVFVMAVFAMNLLANKSINLGVNWLALDCGIIVSWVAFLCMDILTKHFGPKAATQISIFAIAINLFMCLIFFIASKIPGNWGQFYSLGELDVINTAINGTFSSAWYVVFGSTMAMTVSAIINNFANWAVGRTFLKNPDCFGAFVLRSYVSTAIAQFADNFIFALIVSHFFFGWSILQCLTCATFGMLAELIFEAIFSPVGYFICKKWQKNEVGKEFLQYKERV